MTKKELWYGKGGLTALTTYKNVVSDIPYKKSLLPLSRARTASKNDFIPQIPPNVVHKLPECSTIYHQTPC